VGLIVNGKFSVKKYNNLTPSTEMTAKKDRGELIAIKGRKRLYADRPLPLDKGKGKRATARKQEPK